MSALARLLVRIVLASALACLAGCSLLPGWGSRNESERRAQQVQKLQLKVMRYADEYAGRIADPITALKSNARTPEERLAIQDWSITQTSAAYIIASGTNPTINALDMIVLATLSRMVLEQQGISALGERALPLLAVQRSLEPQSWELIDGVLNPDEKDQLQALIVDWRAEHPHARAVTQIRFTSFAAIAATASNPTRTGGSLFSLIGLDPLSNLDPAVRELEQTRLLAERAIYYLQRAPKLLDMQVERLSYQLAVMPEAKQTLASVERVGMAAQAIGELTGDAPAIVATERHALISELTAVLRSEQDHMQQLLQDVRQTLDAGANTSESVTRTIDAIDALVARIKPPRGQPTDSTAAARPFDITEYANTARDVASAAQALQSLLAQAGDSSVGLQRLTSAAKQDAHDVIDFLFWRALALIVTLGSFLLLAAILIRRRRSTDRD